MTEIELLNQILEELKIQTGILQNSFKQKIDPEAISLLQTLAPMVKGTPMEKIFDNLLKRTNKNGN